MELRQISVVVVCLFAVVFGQSRLTAGESSADDSAAYLAGRDSAATYAPAEATSTATRYVIRPDQSRFMAKVKSGGLLWFLGHTHMLAIRDFKGEAQLAPGDIAPASLAIEIKAESLEETAPNFTPEQKKIINTTMRKEVLQVSEYPEITFRSTDIKIEKKGEQQFEARVGGELALHGVSKAIVIPANISLNGETLEATGHFSVKRSDFGVKTHSIKWGTIRVRNKIRFTFNIVAQKS
jgi:polyisoprenoid-binding protein YceI